MKMKCLVGLVVVLFCTICCGGANGPDDGQHFATFRGTLKVSPSVIVEDQVALTIFWQTLPPDLYIEGGIAPQGSCDGTPLWAPAHEVSFYTPIWLQSQSVQYQPQFPIQFEIPVSDPPPDEAMYSRSGKLALGMLIAYQDTNANGAYDFGTLDSSPEPILATSLSDELRLHVAYRDGEIEPRSERDWKAQVAEGYSLVLFEDGSDEQVTFLPADTPIDLTVDEDPYRTYSLGCIQGTHYVEYLRALPPGEEPDCHPWGAAEEYTWFEVVEIEGCQAHTRNVRACLMPESDRPADWPCP